MRKFGVPIGTKKHNSMAYDEARQSIYAEILQIAKRKWNDQYCRYIGKIIGRPDFEGSFKETFVK